MTEVEMPLYECHKEVHAAKITAIENDILILGHIGGRQQVTDGWLARFKPEVGGYYVVYKDGYSSYSPAKAFEEGYSRV